MNLGINFMHFLTPDQQKLGQVTGENSLDIFLIYHALFNVYASSNPAGSPSSRELREGWFCELPSKPLNLKKYAANTFFYLTTSYELTNKLHHLGINSVPFFLNADINCS